MMFAKLLTFLKIVLIIKNIMMLTYYLQNFKLLFWMTEMYLIF